MKQRTLKELSFERILNGIIRRIKYFPHLIAWNFSIQAKTNCVNIKQFKDLHKGERCFLIANGPSLNKTNINLFKDEITFGLNRIYLNYSKMEFKPTYLVCINKLVLTQFVDDFNNEKMPKFFNWRCRKEFLNRTDTYFVEKNLFSSKFSEDISKSLTPAATVTYAALQIIYYMGFSEVIIVGMDHNFDSKEKPNKTEIRKEEVDSNHFAPNYFPKGSKWETPDLVASDYYYTIARKEFEKDGRFIFDATINGKCTIFPKRKLEMFF